MRIYAFDFDGTLTTHDTLIAFIRYAKGSAACFGGFLLHAPWLLLMKLRIYPNWKAKQRVFSFFFRGWPVTRFERVCRDFSRDKCMLMRPKARKYLNEVLEQDDTTVVVVSASIDTWVRPFLPESVVVLGTQVEQQGGVLTGRFLTANCYGEEKVRRLRAMFPNRREYELIAFGDSRGDQEMLIYADKGYYKPFR
ncbi:MAG: HAD family hydrolase [Prevotella sp.]